MFKFSSLKVLLVLLVVSSVFVSCDDLETVAEREISTTISADDTVSCIQVFSYINESAPLEIRKIGYYHNQILEQFSRPPFIEDMCKTSDYELLQDKLDQIILSNTVYSSFFGHVQTTGIAGLYLDNLKVCDVPNPNPDSIMMMLVNQTCNQLKDYLSSFEISFIKSFFINGLIGNLNPIIDYVHKVEQNRSKFIDNGNLALAILSIYENSYCFWKNFKTTNRICPPCAVAAAWDATGAFVEGSLDIYNNGGAPSDHFLKRMGRGALDASIPIVGGKIANWLGW